MAKAVEIEHRYYKRPNERWEVIHGEVYLCPKHTKVKVGILPRAPRKGRWGETAYARCADPGCSVRFALWHACDGSNEAEAFIPLVADKDGPLSPC